MENFYKLNSLLSCSEDVVREVNVNVSGTAASELNLGLVANNFLQLEEPESSERFIKTQIATHPLYPSLVSAYIECRKVGAPPELASLLEEIARENHPTVPLREIGDDPELDEFMESYCEVLHRYTQELSKPFNEATLFLCSIESQLSNLCKGTLALPLNNNRSGKHLISQPMAALCINGAASKEYEYGPFSIYYHYCIVFMFCF